MSKSDPIREAIEKALKAVANTSKANTAGKVKSGAKKVLTRAERKAENQARTAAERVAKTAASRATRAERKVANRAKYIRDADTAVASVYGSGETRIMKAKQEIATELNRSFRVLEGTDAITRRTGIRRKAIDKAINKMQDYLTKEGYGKLTFGEKTRIAKDFIKSTETANRSAGKRLEGTVKYYKEKETGPLKSLGSKVIKEGSSKKSAAKQTAKQRESARAVVKAKKAGREDVVRSAARRAIQKESRGQKLADLGDAKKMANQAEFDRAVAASKQRKLMAQAKKKRLAEMGERSSSKQKSAGPPSIPKSQRRLAELQKANESKFKESQRRVKLTEKQTDARLAQLEKDKANAMKRNKPVQRYGNPATRIRSKKK